MVEVSVVYEGELHCRATHGPSGAELSTDAPVDNHGRGETFSPTDLVATALGSCMLTILGIISERHGLDMRGARVTVRKEMTATAPRRIARLRVEMSFAEPVAEELRPLVEQTVRACPVARSLNPDIEVPVTFHWGA